jgi:Stealth protein CR2, conserved region 2/Stealth protein CR1, conserved region 1
MPRSAARRRPSGRSRMSTDAVITWVDGNDPVHRQQLADYLAARGGTRPLAANPTRFHNAGEIEYCVASILRFAPWLRTIHIVTDGQSPAWLRRFESASWAGRVRVVDHREIFAGFEQHLPTFNSRAIISMLWRIPALAERFVYFNDDFMLLRPVQERDFFRDGRVVLRGKWRLQSAYSWTQAMARARKRWRRGGSAAVAAGEDVEANARDAQEASAQLIGFRRRYYRLYHNPYPFLRSTIEAFFAAHPDLLERNVSHRLRSVEQFKTESLATHLEIAQRNAIRDNRLHTVQLTPQSDSTARLLGKMDKADRDPDAAFACVQSLELATDEEHRAIVAWLDRRIGRLDDLPAAAGNE